MGTAQDEWRPVVAALRDPRYRTLEVDCVAVGIATLGPAAVRIEQTLYLEGEIHEEPRTLESHCASLIAVWSVLQAPSLLDLGNCSCVGRRLLFGERGGGRRFAVHAVRLDDTRALFAVLSSVSPWGEGEQAKSLVAEVARQASRIVATTSPVPTAAVAAALERNEPAGIDCYLFTAREIEILKLLASGMSNKQIARELGSSPNTVRNQIHAVFRKAGVSNRTELALKVSAAF